VTTLMAFEIVPPAVPRVAFAVALMPASVISPPSPKLMTAPSVVLGAALYGPKELVLQTLPDSVPLVPK